MADISDVEAAMATIVGAALYPNGSGSPSAIIGAAAAKIFRGWPEPATLDADIAAGIVNVSIFPMPGTAVGAYQILDQTYTIVPAVYGMSVSVSGNTITVTGQPNAGEFLTVVADGSYAYSATGATTTALLAAVATQAQVNYPTASSTATTLTVPTLRSIVVRQGGTATLGKALHRQKQAVMVTIWAPTDALRVSAATIADIALKQKITLTMPDTSQAHMTYSRTMVYDDKQKAAIYRRDLIYDIEYATVQQFPGTVITTVNTTITSAPSNSQTTALT